MIFTLSVVFSSHIFLLCFLNKKKAASAKIQLNLLKRFPMFFPFLSYFLVLHLVLKFCRSGKLSKTGKTSAESLQAKKLLWYSEFLNL
jgi:hypothetical protein